MGKRNQRERLLHFRNGELPVAIIQPKQYGIIGRYFYVAPQLRLYFSEIEIDEKHMIRDRTDKSQWRRAVSQKIGF